MRKSIILITILAVAALMITACSGSKSSLGADSVDEKTITVTAENASADMECSTTITVDEGEDIVIEPDIEGDGEIRLEFYNSDDTDHKDMITDFTTSGTEPGMVGFGTGEFQVLVISAKDGVTGTVTLRAQSEDGPEQWNEVETAEEAAKGAWLDRFEYGEGVTLSLGEVKAEKIKYMEGVARADVPVAAVEMWICKGLASIDEGDISFDDGEYQHEWTQNVKGLEVKCFGNREGEATKTIWTVDDYAYAIVAHGAGGDDDYGLSSDDLNSLINAIQ